MLIIGIHGKCYPIMKEFLIDAFRFQIIQCDNDNISSTLTEISEMIKYDTMNICVDNIKTLKSYSCLLYTSPSPRDGLLSRMPSSA